MTLAMRSSVSLDKLFSYLLDMPMRYIHCLDGMIMSADTAVRKTVEKLQQSHTRRFPVSPIALVTGPRLEISSSDPDQPFYVASIDKVFIATLIAQLFDEARFGPDTPIGHLLPAADIEPLPAAPGIDNARDVTVEHLLSHTSGLPDLRQPARSRTC